MKRTSMRLRIRASGGRVRLSNPDRPRAAPPRKVVRNIATPAKIRANDALPNPQAFTVRTLQMYPEQTAICRQCEHLTLTNCTRGCCNQLPRSHQALITAISSRSCPMGKF